MLNTIIRAVWGALHPIKVRRVIIYHPDYMEVRNVRIK